MIDTIRQRIQEVFGHHQQYVSAEVINNLFATIPSDETTLTQEIMGYLLEHNFEALTVPQGQSLRERLISTDWRQKEAKKWLVEPEFLVAPVAQHVTVHPVSTPFAQSNRVLVGLVLVIVSVLLWLWREKMSAIDTDAGRVDSSELVPGPEPSATQLKAGRNEPIMAKLPKKMAVLPVKQAAVANDNTNLIPPVSSTNKPTETEVSTRVEAPVAELAKPYDTADSRVGDFGLRAARKGNKWGYINQKDQWHIEPVYDDVMPFHNGKATVVLDGQQIIIDRDGVRIREEG